MKRRDPAIPVSTRGDVIGACSTGSAIRSLALLAVLLGTGACASTGEPAQARASDPVVPAEEPVVVEPPPPPVIHVRDFPVSDRVSVVAWSPDATWYGLRASIRRDGMLVGSRLGYHTFYMSSTFVEDMGGFRHAVIPPEPERLTVSFSRDLYPCHGGEGCSPMVFVGVAVSDEMLRAHRDRLALRFHPPIGEPWTITLDREFIDAYLHTVDSVRSAKRDRSASR
jgi:hypothetical protein